jgi:DNA-binding MarR family transcriptional regulator
LPGESNLRELTQAVRGLAAGADHYRRTIAAALGLSNSAVAAMGHLHHKGPLTPRALAADLALTTGSITALVDRLCEAGYAERTAHPSDRRSLFVALTAKGKRAIVEGHDAADAMLEKALSRLAERGMFDGLDLPRVAAVVGELGIILSALDVDTL